MVGRPVDQVVEVDGPFLPQQVLVLLPDPVEYVEEVAGATLVPLGAGALFDFLFGQVTRFGVVQKRVVVQGFRQFKR